jgi:hypothetical protein
MLRHAAIALVALSIAAPAAAKEFKAVNKLTVGQITPAVFEVVSRPGKSGANNFWCAAADYARKHLAAPGNARVYVAQARGASTLTPGRSGVRFTLDPAAAGIEPIAPRTSLSVDHVGDNLTINFGMQYCTVEINTN